MKFSIACICGYQTPLVENKKDIDYDLLDSHQQFCKVYLAMKGFTKSEYTKEERKHG